MFRRRRNIDTSSEVYTATEKKFLAKLRKANSKWERYKLSQGQRSRSVASGAGHLAILVSGRIENSDRYTYDERKEKLFDLESYAQRLGIEREDGHRAVFVFWASNIMVRKVIKNPNVTDIITIGYFGDIGTLSADSGTAAYDWWDLSKMATHLKTGTFEHRQDGNMPHDGSLTAPLGSFLLTNPANFVVAEGAAVPAYDPGDEISFIDSPLHPGGNLVEQIMKFNKRSIPYREFREVPKAPRVPSVFPMNG